MRTWAVLGDVHGLFDDADVAYFNQSGYEGILCVGDLCAHRLQSGVRVCRLLAQLKLPVWVLPGNHDGPRMAQLAAEVFAWRRAARIFSFGQTARVRRLEAALGSAQLVGYETLPLCEGLSLLAARPHSLGGKTLGSARFLEHQFGVSDMDESREKLLRLLQGAATEDILVLAHNGPYGLGADPDALWGCDFNPELGDFGDEDLAEALEQAPSFGKRVRGVVAGHMHWDLKGGGERKWIARSGDTLYVNAARVPRIEGKSHHYIRLAWDGQKMDAWQGRFDE